MLNYKIMTLAEYHAHSSMSKSGLDLIARSPLHYRCRDQRKETRAMLIGSATHAAILEPELYAKTYITVKSPDRKKKEWNDAVKENPDKLEYMLTMPESENINLMATAVRSNDAINSYISEPGHAEISFFAKDPETGVAVKIRLDYLNAQRMGVLDLKTTNDCRNDQFARSVTSYRYHVQQAFYSDVFLWATGEKLQDFAFGAIESDRPHASALVRLPDDYVAYGRMLYRRDLNTYARCLESGVWPPPNPEPFVLHLPQYAMYQMDEDIMNIEMQGVEQ